MAVDIQLNQVHALVQGASTANVVSSNAPNVTTSASGITAGADHSVFANTGRLSLSVGSTTLWNRLLIELVIEQRGWTPRAGLVSNTLFKIEGDAEIANRYRLFTNDNAAYPFATPSWRSALTVFDLPASGKVMVRLYGVEDGLGGVSLSCIIVPQTGLSISTNLGTVPRGNIYSLSFGAPAGTQSILPPANEASASASASVLGVNEFATPSVFSLGGSYNTSGIPNSGSATIGMLGVSFTASAAGMSAASLLSVLAQGLASELSAAGYSASAGFDGTVPTITTNPKSTDGPHNLGISGTITFSSGSSPAQNLLNTSKRQQEQYGAPPGVRQTTVFSVFVADPSKAYDLTVSFGSLTATASLQNNVLAGLESIRTQLGLSGFAWSNPSQGTYVANYQHSTVGAFAASASIQESVGVSSSIAKLYGLRITTENRDDQAFPTLPWPSTSIPGGGGGGGGGDGDTLLLLHFNDTAVQDGSNTYLDSSGNNRVVTGTHSTTDVQPVPVQNGSDLAPSFGKHLFIDRTPGDNGGGLTIGTPISVTGPWTLEWRWYTPEGSSGINIYKDTNNVIQNIATSGSFFHGTGSGSELVMGSSYSSDFSWRYLALVNDGTNLKLYSGGNVFLTAAGNFGLSLAFITSGPWNGSAYTNHMSATMRIEEVRLSDVARYTGNFTAPTEPFPDGGGGGDSDVQGAGYNDVADFTSTGQGNQQATAPDAYGSGNVTLEDFAADQSIVIDNNSVDGSSAVTLADFTNTGDWVAAAPTNADGAVTLDDFTTDGSGVATVPIEIAIANTLEDFTQLAVGLFLAPAEGTADALLGEFTSVGAAELRTPESGRINVTMPIPAVLALGQPKDDRLHVTIPPLSVQAHGRGAALVSMPAATTNITGTVPNVGTIAAAMPFAEVQATGRVSGTGAVQVFMPSTYEMVGYGGGVLSATVDGYTAQFAVTSGTAGRVAATLPMVVVEAVGTRTNTGQIAAVMPMLVPSPAGRLVAVMPMVRVVASGSAVVTVAHEAYVLNMSKPMDDNPRNNFEAKNDQMTRYTNFPFTQVVRYLNSYYGVAADGLYLLEGTTDNGAPIDWDFDLCMTDFGSSEKKNVAAVYLGGQAGPTVDFTIQSGETPDQLHAHTTTAITAKRNHRQKFGLGRRTRYYSLGLSGQGDLAIDSIEFEVANTTRRI